MKQANIDYLAQEIMATVLELTPDGETVVPALERAIEQWKQHKQYRKGGE